MPTLRTTRDAKYQRAVRCKQTMRQRRAWTPQEVEYRLLKAEVAEEEAMAIQAIWNVHHEHRLPGGQQIVEDLLADDPDRQMEAVRQLMHDVGIRAWISLCL